MRVIFKGSASKKHKIAVSAFKAGNYKLARKEWENIEDNLALKGLAFIALHENQTREARSYFDELLETAALDPEVHNGLALCYLAEGKSPEAVEVLLDALEDIPSPLLKNTLETIRKGRNPSLSPLMVITLPSPGFHPFAPILALIKKMGWHLIWIIIPLIAFLLFLSYPYLRNASLFFNIRNRGAAIPIKPIIIGMEDIISARENPLPAMDNQTASDKAALLRSLLAEKKPNQARILANEVLSSEAPEGIKERVYILEGFIGQPDSDNIDYIPSYKEIASRPSLYQGVMVRWQGLAVNLHHEGRSKTVFDLLIGYDGKPQVQGIAFVETQGLKELQNGTMLTVIGAYKGLTPDNKVIIEAVRIIQ